MAAKSPLDAQVAAFKKLQSETAEAREARNLKERQTRALTSSLIVAEGVPPKAIPRLFGTEALITRAMRKTHVDALAVHVQAAAAAGYASYAKHVEPQLELLVRASHFDVRRTPATDDDMIIEQAFYGVSIDKCVFAGQNLCSSRLIHFLADSTSSIRCSTSSMLLSAPQSRPSRQGTGTHSRTMLSGIPQRFNCFYFA